MKTIPLIKANLKQFMRNWKSILLLVIMPLILILIIFTSFNPSGLRRIDIGYSMADNQTLDEKQFQEAVGAFARLTRFSTPDDCQRSLRDYNEYVCVHVSGSGPYVLDVYYDNTREPVIWEVIERLDQAVRNVQKQHSRAIASDFLTRFQRALNRLDEYDRQLTNVNSDLDTYTAEVDRAATKLQGAKTELTTTLASMDRDIADAKTASANGKSVKASYVNSISSSLYVTEQNIYAITSTPETSMYRTSALGTVSDARRTLNDYNAQADQQFNTIDGRIWSYEQASARGKQHTYEIDAGISDLRSTKTKLQQYKQRVSGTKQEMQGIKGEFNNLRTLNADNLVNPVVIRNYPTYIPDIEQERIDRANQGLTESEAAAKGASFITLQTVFPTVLILITLFLSLLIGSFVALGEVNAPAHMRIKMVDGASLPEFLASFISSLIIVLVPVFVVLAIGNWIFELGVFDHLFTVSAIIVLLISIFVLIGFLLAYLVRKESLTLMISTFVLVLLIFFSGFLLPLERMTPFFGFIAGLSPGALALSMFKQSVFYSSGFSGIALEFMQLLGQMVLLLLLTLLVRWWKD